VPWSAGTVASVRRNRAAYGVLQPEEVPENALFCASERSHLSAGTRPAQHRYEGDYKQLTKIIARVTGARVGDIFEGGQENLHAGGSMD
jgi:hypothetical protein